MAFILRNLSLCGRLSKKSFFQFSQHRSISKESVKQLTSALRNRKEVVFRPCSVGVLNLGQPFSSSNLNVYAFVKDEDGIVVQPEHFSHKNNLGTYSICLDEMYQEGFKELACICNNGYSRHPVSTSPLLQFLEDIEEIELSLFKLHKDSPKVLNHISDAEVSALLAVHLISRLVAGSQMPYMISNDTKMRTKYCPCGCRMKIIYGNTGFGSEDLWYGKPDIMAFPKGAGGVSVILNKDSFREMTADHVKEDRERNSLLQNGNISQITAQAITFSFYQNVFQEKKSVAESDIVTLIPTVAMCANGIEIYMYDSKYDIFLRSHHNTLPFWDESYFPPKLDLNTIVTLWLVFNHLTFKPSIPEKLLQSLKGSCGFLDKAGLEKIEKVKKNIRMQTRFPKND